MIEKVGHVKNPLTIIAIFAGLAEVCGTLVLPLLEPSVQKVFVYFLMGFPSLLIIGFFAILWFKHDVLYAPSDFRSDESFNIYRRSPGEKLAQEAEDLNNIEDSPIDNDINEPANNGSHKTETDNPGSNSSEVSPSDEAKVDPLKKDSDLNNRENNKDKAKNSPSERSSESNSKLHDHYSALNSYVAEQMALDKLSFEMGVKFERNFSFGKNTRIIDAISLENDRVVLVETKFVTNEMSLSIRISDLFQTLNEAQKNIPTTMLDKTTGIGVIILDSRLNEKSYAIKAIEHFKYLTQNFSREKINLELRIYYLDNRHNKVVDITPGRDKNFYKISNRINSSKTI